MTAPRRWRCASAWPPPPIARTAAYDAAIARWFAGQLGETFPPRLIVAGTRRQALRYGENPHQQAAFYSDRRAGARASPRPRSCRARS